MNSAHPPASTGPSLSRRETRLTLVDVHEASRPAEGEPIHWRLLTTHPSSASPALLHQATERYKGRWTDRLARAGAFGYEYGPSIGRTGERAMASERLLSGPFVPPKAGGAPKQLIVLLHGIGADGSDLISLAPYYHSVLPHAHIVSPHAPFPFDMAPFGYMWFSVGNLSLETRMNGVRTAAPVLDAFLDAELARHGLRDADLLLIGFSQGGMMALHVGLRRPRSPAGIISHSGMLVADARFASEIRNHPPVLLTHGAIDEVLPAACLPAAEAVLKGAGVPVEAHLIPGLGHGIDEATLRLDLRFLSERFPSRRSARPPDA